MSMFNQKLDRLKKAISERQRGVPEDKVVVQSVDLQALLDDHARLRYETEDLRAELLELGERE